MHARVTIAEGDPARADDAAQVIREQVLPGVRELDGFRGAIGLSDRETGKSITVTLWESQQAMLASEQAANRLRSDVMEALGASKPTVERYEVVLWEV